MAQDPGDVDRYHADHRTPERVDVELFEHLVDDRDAIEFVSVHGGRDPEYGSFTPSDRNQDRQAHGSPHTVVDQGQAQT